MQLKLIGNIYKLRLKLVQREFLKGIFLDEIFYYKGVDKFMENNDCLAIILAGGEGKRLGVLTEEIPKPIVPFGGKYRIIDFVLSNCVNSGIKTVGILTQYKSHLIKEYIDRGQYWGKGLNRIKVHILSAGEKSEYKKIYKGTANAVYQNISFIEKFNPKYVLILSGDHIYKMDYKKMLSFHIDNNATATIATIDVPWQEASNFGIIVKDKRNIIREFYEKPSNPLSNKASMGIYVFTWDILKKYLTIDENNEKSSNDFGKDVIPYMVNSKEKVFAYDFYGYWKDVGTIKCLWQANMDIIALPDVLKLEDREWEIFSREKYLSVSFIREKEEKIKSSYIVGQSKIHGYVENSILSEGVFIDKNVYVKDSIIFPNVRIKEGTIIEKTIIASNTYIGNNCIIGKTRSRDNPYESNHCQEDIVVINSNINVPDRSFIHKNSMVKEIIKEIKQKKLERFIVDDSLVVREI